ncbi:hypothetical protein BE21_57500 [Sorangium cellulosum]|uniref:Uncharacterized protein n=1 Tax=Sorangium cellulosum TaxID=56 RepID=A0A150U3Q6_SORCE|nr:hypothetical protein BE21_57500 [Sorangium cellulosum]
MADVQNPLDTPDAFNFFTVDGLRSPGLALLTSGGNREDEFVHQQSPMLAGAYTVFRGQKNSSVTYQIQLWTTEHFEAWKAFVEALKAGRKKRPPKVWRLADQRVAHNDILTVSVGNIGAQMKIGPTKFAYEVTFIENRKRKPWGGPAKPPKNKWEERVVRQEAENNALREQLAAAKKAAE